MPGFGSARASGTARERHYESIVSLKACRSYEAPPEREHHPAARCGLGRLSAARRIGAQDSDGRTRRAHPKHNRRRTQQALEGRARRTPCRPCSSQRCCRPTRPRAGFGARPGEQADVQERRALVSRWSPVLSGSVSGSGLDYAVLTTQHGVQE